MPSNAFEIETLIHLEQSFFDVGYADGHAHGRIHGLIEGRAVGRDKGYAIWEEIGFYAGFARVWASQDANIPSRIESHARHLLELVALFPRTNPSHADERDIVQDDLEVLLSKVRARYKALCATLGVKPRLRPTNSDATIDTHENITDISEAAPRKNIWKLQGFDHNSNEMNF